MKFIKDDVLNVQRGKSIGINPLFINMPNGHHPGILFKKYIFEKNLSIQCMNIIPQRPAGKRLRQESRLSPLKSLVSAS